MPWIRGKYDGGAVPLRFFLVPYRVISDTYGVWVYDADAGFVRGYEPSLDSSFYGWRNGIMVIRDKVGDQDVVVLWYAPTKTAAVYATLMGNEQTPVRLTLERNPQIATAPFVDKETASHWTIEGRAVAGPLKGKVLAWLPGVQCKWFAWAAEYPATEIYSASPDRKGR